MLAIIALILFISASAWARWMVHCDWPVTRAVLWVVLGTANLTTTAWLILSYRPCPWNNAVGWTLTVGALAVLAYAAYRVWPRARALPFQQE